MTILIDNIIQQYQAVQNEKLWIGSTFESKLNQVYEKHVFSRPIEGLHSIAEIISHLTFWREETILKIRTGKGAKTDDCEENWRNNDELRLMGWQHVKSEYDRSLTELIGLLKTKDDDFLNQQYYDTDFKDYYEYSFVVYGMLHHDIYHLGQIGIIIKYLDEQYKNS